MSLHHLTFQLRCRSKITIVNILGLGNYSVTLALELQTWILDLARESSCHGGEHFWQSTKE